jgi:hypothetical protein
MIKNTIMEQATNFNYLGPQLGSNINYDLQNKLQRQNNLCQTIKHTLLNKTQCKIILKFCIILAVPSLSYSSECWTLTK